MNQEQLDHIVLNSEWNEERQDWLVPNFNYREKNTGLPKLSGKMTRNESTELEKEKKEVIFKTHSSRDMEKSNGGN